MIKFGEMHHHRAGDLILHVEVFLDANPVVADRSVNATVSSSKVAEFATEAESDRSNLAFTGLVRLQDCCCRLHIFNRLGNIKLLKKAKGFLEFFFTVSQFDTGLHPPEKIWRQNRVPFLSVVIGHIANVPVDAKYLLQEQNTRTGAHLGGCEITLKPSRAVGRRDIYICACHFFTPIKFAQNINLT